MSIRNPEFQRQIWLNLRPALLAWSLGLSALVLALPAALAQSNTAISEVFVIACMGMWLAAFVYGSVLAARSLTEEFQQNTWDWQRLSALSPWQMAWGKLAATLPAWLYVLWFAIAAISVAVSRTEVEQPSLLLALHTLGLAALWGLGVQVWAMNWVLMNRAHLLHAVVPVLAGIFVFVSLQDAVDASAAMMWWHMALPPVLLAYVAGVFVLLLGALALWRQLCARLDVRTLPWAWPVGILTASFFFAGFTQPHTHGFFNTAFELALIGTVFAALLHMADHLRAWRQVQWAWQRKQWSAVWQALPLWPISLALALLCLSVATLEDVVVHKKGDASEIVFALFLWAQIGRDCLVLTGFSLLLGKLRSPLAGFMLTLVLLYLVLPLLAYGIAGWNGALFMLPLLGVGSDANVQADGLWLVEGGVWLLSVVCMLQIAQILAALGWVVYLFKRRLPPQAQRNAQVLV